MLSRNSNMSEYFQILHDGTTHLLQLLENDCNKIVVLFLWLVVLSAVMLPTVMLLSTRVTAMTSRVRGRYRLSSLEVDDYPSGVVLICLIS